MDRFRERLDPNQSQRTAGPRTWRDNMTPDFKSACPSLSYETRLWGFLSCVAFGALLSGFSTFFVYLGKLRPFAIYYSLGSLSGLFASTFLVGPCRQCSTMFAKSRWLISSIYILAILGTLAVVYLVESRFQIFMIIGCIAVQFLAAFWYGLSYIPYGRTVVKKLLAFTFCGDIKALDV